MHLFTLAMSVPLLLRFIPEPLGRHVLDGFALFHDASAGLSHGHHLLMRIVSSTPMFSHRRPAFAFPFAFALPAAFVAAGGGFFSFAFDVGAAGFLSFVGVTSAFPFALGLAGVACGFEVFAFVGDAEAAPFAFAVAFAVFSAFATVSACARSLDNARSEEMQLSAAHDADDGAGNGAAAFAVMASNERNASMDEDAR